MAHLNWLPGMYQWTNDKNNSENKFFQIFNTFTQKFGPFFHRIEILNSKQKLSSYFFKYGTYMYC